MFSNANKGRAAQESDASATQNWQKLVKVCDHLPSVSKTWKVNSG